MKKTRRSFIRLSGLAGFGLAGNKLFGSTGIFPDVVADSLPAVKNSAIMQQSDSGTNLIGPYGNWAAGLIGKDLPSMSYRRKEWEDIDLWRKEAKKRLSERLAIPEIPGIP